MHYSFDHRGVHFIALDNVSRGRPEVGTAQRAWRKTDPPAFLKVPIIGAGPTIAAVGREPRTQTRN
jgi:hypothetical protein